MNALFPHHPAEVSPLQSHRPRECRARLRRFTLHVVRFTRPKTAKRTKPQGERRYTQMETRGWVEVFRHEPIRRFPPSHGQQGGKAYLKDRPRESPPTIAPGLTERRLCLSARGSSNNRSVKCEGGTLLFLGIARVSQRIPCVFFDPLAGSTYNGYGPIEARSCWRPRGAGVYWALIPYVGHFSLPTPTNGTRTGNHLWVSLLSRCSHDTRGSYNTS